MDNNAPIERRVRITDAGNTFSHALHALRLRGYAVFIYPDDDPNSPPDYWAVKDGRDFIADSPVSVLGLVTLWEEFGDDWRDVVVPDEYDRVSTWSRPHDNYASMTDAEFATLVNEAREYLSALGVDLPTHPTREELALTMTSYYKQPDDE